MTDELTTTRRPDVRKVHLPLRERELLVSHQVAALLNVSKTTILEWDREEVMPAPMRDGPCAGRVFWRTREVLAWVEAGCPRRVFWQWKPSLLPKLDDLLKEKRIELRDVELEIRRLRVQIEDLQRAGAGASQS